MFYDWYQNSWWEEKIFIQNSQSKGCFLVTEPYSEFREAVNNIIPGEPFAENFSFGFIDKKQKKLWVLTDTELPTPMSLL